MGREFNREDGTALRGVCSGDLASVFVDDSVCDGQSEPRALADFLRRVERLEDAG